MVTGHTRLAYGALLLLVAAERLVELRIARRNARAARARGAIEVGSGHYPWMVALHTALFPACVLEVWGFNRPWTPGVGIPALTALGAAVAMRGWVLATLGRRWTTRVLYVPGDPLVTSGPFRWLRHPNYLVVRVEVAAIPLVHGAWVTALVFSAANTLLLRTRVKVEDGLLRRAARLPEGGRP